jgi:hypothetical protein
MVDPSPPAACCLCSQSSFESELQIHTVKDYVSLSTYFEGYRALQKEKKHLLEIIEVGQHTRTRTVSTGAEPQRHWR